MADKTELLKKIQALAESGVGGEKKNAERLLDQLLKKYGITADELSEETRRDERFIYHGAEEEQLLIQVVYKVRNDKTGMYDAINPRTGRRRKTVLITSVTPSEKIEIEFLFDWYKKQWEREKKMFMSAFIQKHRIFGEATESAKEDTLSLDDLNKMWQMINAMEDVSPVRRLEVGR